MDALIIKDFSARLKEIANGLSFLGHPRYQLRELYLLFPQHKNFIDQLEDVSVPFPVKLDEKKKAIDDLLRDLALLTESFPLKKIFLQRVRDYSLLISMLENFGTELFYHNCVKLYGSSHRLTQNNGFLYFLDQIPQFCTPDDDGPRLQGEEAQHYLRHRLLETFAAEDVDVRASHSLLSDSSAGRKSVKLNPEKSYTKKQLDIFLVHEGWVHLGTSLNGAAQINQPWLASWAPRTTFMQEGLAILTELISGCMTLERWNKVVLRHHATTMAERGSSILEVYHFLQNSQLEDLDAFKLALRVFRGVPLAGGMAFTKELLYLHGLIELLYHLQFYQLDLRPLWVGKMSFEEHLILMDQGPLKQLQLKYFPAELENIEGRMRLKKLKDLASTIFTHGFL